MAACLLGCFFRLAGQAAATPPSPGTPVWQFPTGGWVLSSPALSTNGTLYIGSLGNRVHALDARTGAVRWELVTGEPVVTTPAIGADGTVYVGTDEGRLHALDGATGAERWRFVAGGQIESSAALGADGVVYVGSDDRHVYALAAASGAVLWKFTTGDWVRSSPAVAADGTVYAGSYDQKVYALDGASGRKRWEFTSGGWISSSPAIGADGAIYVGSFDHKVYALDGASGAKRWEFLTGGMVESSPVIGLDGVVYIGSDDGKVHALDGATGAARWSFATTDWVQASPVLGHDGALYIGSWDGTLYALDAATGAKRWTAAGSSPIASSAAIGSDGTVYFGSADGAVHAVRGQSLGGLAESPWPAFRQNQARRGRSPGVAAPVVRLQPHSQATSTGESVTFQVEAAGTPPLGYQWLVNSAPIPGATNRTLDLPKVGMADLGAYSVRVSNAAGSAQSDPARLVLSDAPGLVAEWSLDQDGDTGALDHSVLGNDGRVRGALLELGRVGRALSFNGTNAFVDIPNDPSLNFAGAITLAAWIKPVSSQGVQNIIAHGYTAHPQAEVALRIFNGYYQVGSWDGIPHGVAMAVPPEDLNRWVHLAGVYDGTNWVLYRQGRKAASQADATGAVTVDADWAIGARGGGGERYFHGLIDEARIYDRPLALHTIRALAGLEDPPAGADVLWVDDALPPGVETAAYGGEKWTWADRDPFPVSGASAHRSPPTAGLHQHYFNKLSPAWPVGVGETLVVYVFLDPARLPRMTMVQWADETGSWEHRAYWGENLWRFGQNTPTARRHLGPLPVAGRWVRLEVPAAKVGLENRAVSGISFVLFDGAASWDHAGKAVRAWDIPWLKDALPAAARPVPNTGEEWTWTTNLPPPYAQLRAHVSDAAAGFVEHAFELGPSRWRVRPGDSLICRAYLDPAQEPSMLMLRWRDGAGSWNHRAYWGSSSIAPGIDGTASQRSLGALPAAGEWVRLAVPASLVGLEDQTVTGLGFGAAGGRVFWLGAGKATTQAPPAAPRLGRPVGLVNQTLELAWTGDSSASYALEASSDLVNWEIIGDAGPANPLAPFRDRFAPGLPGRFYRIVWDP